MSEKSMAVTRDGETQAKVVESLVLRGDLSGLSPQHRARYYVQTCEQLGLNPSAKPFDFLKLNGKEILYANKGATDQLAAIHRVNREIIDGPKVIDLAGTKLVYAVCRASLPNGRFETATATVPLVDPMNVLMKAETKAKRRATMSILGLALLDEMELETIPANVQSPGGGVDLSLAALGIEQRDPRTAPTQPAPAMESEQPRDLVAEVRESAAVRHDVRELADLWRAVREELKAAKLEQKAWDAITARCAVLKIIPKSVTAEIKRLDDESRGPGPKGGTPKPAAQQRTDAQGTGQDTAPAQGAQALALVPAWCADVESMERHVAAYTCERHIENAARCYRTGLPEAARELMALRVQRLSYDAPTASELAIEKCRARVTAWIAEGRVENVRPAARTKIAAGGR